MVDAILKRDIYTFIREKINSILFEENPDGVEIVDEDGYIVACNKAQAHLLQYSPKEIIGHHITDFLTEQHKELFKQKFESLKGGKSIDFEIESVRKDGFSIYIWSKVNPIKGEDGHFIGAIIYNRDITSYKRRESALWGDLERYRAISDGANDLIQCVGPSRNFLYVNEKWRKTLGYSDEEIVHLKLDDVLSPESLRKCKKVMEKVRSGGTVTGVEIVFITRDGKEVFTEGSINGYFRDGKFIGTRGIFRDLTERKRMEREKAELQERLLHAQKMEAIGTLAGGIAHDFNNILMAIMGSTSLMLFSKNRNDPEYEYLKNIERMVKRGANLTKQLLGFARRGKYEVEPTDINELIEKTSQIFAETKKEITIHRKLAPDLPPIEANAGQIEQVLMNIFVNAWQAMPGGGEIYIETKKEKLGIVTSQVYGVRPGTYIRCSITDTGEGMDKETQKRIFEPFFSTKEREKGTGLGLAMAYGIVRNHGGAIEVESEKGAGATFHIYLPISERAITREREREKMLVGGSETILLVDDEQQVIDVQRELLERLGYRVFVARSGAEAIKIYLEQKDSIDLVVLDLIMPGMDGGETFEELKQIDPEIRAILVSGYAEDDRTKEVISQGISGFIQKPYTPQLFCQEIRKVLDSIGKK